MTSFPFSLPLLLDGATGTNLIAAGLPSGVCVEQWILEHPQAILDLQSAFIAAGSQAVYAPTFGANRHKLASYGLEDKVDDINKRLVELTSRVARPAGVLVGGDMSPTGLLIEPYGDASFEDLYRMDVEQATALKEAGVDFLAVETQLSLADMRAGVLAAKSVGLPVIATLTVEENGRSIMGTKPLAALITLQAMGADAVGLNCSTGPQRMGELLQELLPHATVPLVAKPNAGKPRVDDPSAYNLSPEQFAREMTDIYANGARILGGCCGSTPAHIQALRDAIAHIDPPAIPSEPDSLAAATDGEIFFLGDDIALSEPIACSYDLSDDLIDLEDETVTAALVRVDNREDAQLLAENAGMTRLPIAVLANDADTLEYTLRHFQGRLLVDSNCALSREQLEPIAKKYGAIIY